MVLIPIEVGGREMMLLGRHELRVWLSAELRTNLASSVDKEIEKLEADRFRTPFAPTQCRFSVSATNSMTASYEMRQLRP
jgi:hypothetical protein